VRRVPSFFVFLPTFLCLQTGIDYDFPFRVMWGDKDLFDLSVRSPHVIFFPVLPISCSRFSQEDGLRRVLRNKVLRGIFACKKKG